MSEPHYLETELYELVRDDRTVFDFLQNGSLDGLWYWDLENNDIEWMSPRFWTTFGYDPKEKEHLASEWQSMIHPEDLRVALDNFRRHSEDPDHPYDQTVRYRHKNGSTVWVRCRGLIIRDEAGKPRRMLGAHTNVTELQLALQESERLRAELEGQYNHELDRAAELELVNRNLKRSNRELFSFASVASHDLKEPLRSVTAYAEILQERVGHQLDPSNQRYLEQILAGGRRMEQLIMDLLELAQTDSNELNASPVDLNQCFDDVLENLSAKIMKTGAVISYADLPTVSGNLVQLTRLFQNLVNNALTYAGEAHPEITVRADSSDDGWVISVADNGIGFNPAEADKLFKIFSRLHSYSEYPGTGIGLATVQRIAERHGGKVWAEGTPGQGATFFVSLLDATSDPPVSS
ncbi:MAG: ATP-binding protein [Myxococcota bacterium]